MSQGIPAPVPDAGRPVPASWSQTCALLALAGRSVVLVPLVLAVLQALLPLLGLLAMRSLVDAVADGMRGAADAAAAATAVAFATATAAFVAVAGTALRSVAAYCGELRGRALADAVAARLLAHSADQALVAFDDPAFHRALQLAQGEAAQRPVRLVQDLAAVAAALTQGVAMALVLTFADPWLPAWVAAAALPTAWARRREARQRFAFQQQQLEAQRELGVRSAALVGRAQAREVRAYGLAAPFLARIGGLRRAAAATLAQLLRRRAGWEVFAGLCASAALFLAYWLLGQAALAGALSLGGLVLHAQACQRVQNALRDLLAAGSAVAEARLFLAPLVGFLATSRPQGAAAPVAGAPRGPLALELRGVGFTHQTRAEPLFAGLDWQLPPGSRWALVGANGSGKSTLLALLLRLYDPTTGALLANGVDLRTVPPADWRGQAAVLFQDSVLWELPLREQFGFGRATGTVDANALWALLDALGMGARLRALPAGLDTVPSPRVAGGVVFSAGEQRRLLLVRALLHQGPLLLLDEPFAGLDAASSAALVALLRTRPAGQTVVVAEHRPDVLLACEQVAWLRAGVLRTGSAAALRADPEFTAWAGPAGTHGTV
ncbi:MAG: ABC transporter ATP-binding protein [Planctomycetes bacterium]|nr:ABC transporter ATP-binding protein [Planctomycetota bacterium]